ncbi:helix-turn-helix transcriptional regulator [Amphritea sp. HPY]|uniref:helix-turn-helix transcriptional regulator n=1 Tax=Amphritea sp. HPY TaxID=3421652 RepID=UPI003D7CBF99
MNDSTDWGLAPLIDSVGTEVFEKNLVDSMRRLVGANHCILVKYPREKKRCLTLFTQGDISEDLARECSELYDHSYYTRDPTFINDISTCDFSSPVFLHREFDDIDDKDYRHTLIERCHILDKLSLLHESTHWAYCLSLYRLEDVGRFQSGDVGCIQEWGEVLAALLKKHINLMEKDEVQLTFSWISRRLMSSCGDILTDREREVCAMIILGYSSVAIGLNLNISVNTVLTHRRKSYEKLGIGTQSQLFSFLV